MKNLAFFDLDNVIYEGHSIFDLIKDQEGSDFLVKGTWDKIALLLKEYKEGKRTYQEAADGMLSSYAIALKGKNYSDLVYDNLEFFKKNKDKFFEYFTILLPKLRRSYQICLVTTNFQFTAEAIAKYFKLDSFISSEVEVNNGILTGSVKSSMAGNKGLISGMLSNSKNGSFAVGDSVNDIEMLEQVEVPLCFEPDPKLTEKAKKEGWTIVNRINITKTILELV